MVSKPRWRFQYYANKFYFGDGRCRLSCSHGADARVKVRFGDDIERVRVVAGQPMQQRRMDRWRSMCITVLKHEEKIDFKPLL